MAKLFHIKASPRGSRSASQAVASRFIESYRATHANDIVDTLDLWRADLPEINGAMLDAAYALKRGHPLTLPNNSTFGRPSCALLTIQIGRQVSPLAADVEFQHPV
jgi:FMN-dependent NADH-azoreductase